LTDISVTDERELRRGVRPVRARARNLDHLQRANRIQ
jgi:hypothetical protein